MRDEPGRVAGVLWPLKERPGLIERALPSQPGGETSFERGPDGMRCVIIIPLSASMAVGNANG